jgi:glyoxylase-like metal-dependent hydrolase (beta-lactamase superfamily II)
VAAIPFVRDIEFDYGRVDQVSPLVRRVIARNPGPFTFTGTGTYIIGHGTVAVIDPGPEMDEHLDALLAAVQGERVSHVLITHTHADHSPLAERFKAATGAEVLGLPAPRGATAGEGPSLDEPNEPDFVPDRVVADGERVSGPGWTMEAMTTPGHASNHLCWALVEENALFSGDHVMGWSTTVVSPPDGDMGDYYASLHKVAQRDFATLWPTHGPPITDVAPFLDAYRDHRLERERQIQAFLAAGPAAIPDIVRTLYAAVDPRLHPAAARSVLAHLIHLARQGRVIRETSPDGTEAYRLARTA